MKKFFKIILVNISVLLGLLIFLNLSIILIYQFYSFFKVDNYDPRSNLPNYKNIDWASSHFKELNNLETDYYSYIGWRRKEFEGETININKEGIRHTVQSELVSDSSKVAIFLGSSLIWGTGVNDSSTIPSFFSLLSSGKYFSLNFGESEYSPYQSLLMLKSKLNENYSPNLVISYDGPNMMFSLIKGNNINSHSRENLIRSIINKYYEYDNTKIFTFYDFFIKKIELFLINIYNKYFNTKINEFNNNIDQINKAAIYLCDIWLEIHDLCKKNNSKFIAVLAQDYSIGNPNLTHLNYKKIESTYPILYDKIKKTLNLKKYKELSNNILIIDEEIFSNDEYYYIDKSHISPNGNLLIAQIILDKVSTLDI